MPETPDLALTGMTLGADPARVFHHINDFLCQHAEVGRYATMFFGMLDREGNLDYLNAGHPSPLLLRGGEVSEIFTEGSFPVGLLPEANYVVARVSLEPGDTLVLFSDGVTEAANLLPASTKRPSINFKRESSIPWKILRAERTRPTTSLFSSSVIVPPRRPPNPELERVLAAQPLGLVRKRFAAELRERGCAKV